MGLHLASSGSIDKKNFTSDCSKVAGVKYTLDASS